MKLPYQVLHDLTDAQTNFEKLQNHGLADDTAAGGDLAGTYPKPSIAAGHVTAAKLATGIVLQLAATGTARVVAFGNGLCVQNGTAETNAVDVTHGLGVAAQVVLGTVTGGALAQPLVCRWDSAASTATTFRMRVESSAAIGFNVGFAWIAIG